MIKAIPSFFTRKSIKDIATNGLKNHHVSVVSDLSLSLLSRYLLPRCTTNCLMFFFLSFERLRDSYELLSSNGGYRVSTGG